MMKYILSLVFVFASTVGLYAQSHKLEVKGSPHGTIVVQYTMDGKQFKQELTPMVSLMTFMFKSGTQVTLEVKPAPGFKFVRWTDGLSGTNTRMNLNMDKDKTVGNEIVAEENKP